MLIVVWDAWFLLGLTCSFLHSFCDFISCWLLAVAFFPVRHGSAPIPSVNLGHAPIDSSALAVLPFLGFGGAPFPRPRRSSLSLGSAVLPFLGLGSATEADAPISCWLLAFVCFGRARLHSNSISLAAEINILEFLFLSFKYIILFSYMILGGCTVEG